MTHPYSVPHTFQEELTRLSAGILAALSGCEHAIKREDWEDLGRWLDHMEARTRERDRLYMEM